MRVRVLLCTMLSIPSALAAWQHDHPSSRAATPPTSTAPTVPLYANLGTHRLAISTAVPLAQEYFNQGLRLLYGFNHAESVRSFLEAERIDPQCAMCAWGVALASGPNINASMDAGSGQAAWEAIGRARARAERATALVEHALIEALALRYGRDPLADRSARDSAYARAMQAVSNAFPRHLEAQVLTADALMNLSPWNYWDGQGRPRPHTAEILKRLEGVLDLNPDHPGACHLFIHAVEAQDPARAVPCAERLADLMPGAGHLVHMPAHIYIRVGRYDDAIRANEHAAHADETWLEGPAGRRGIYAGGYYPHNYDFLRFAASMAGRQRLALEAARKAAARVSPQLAREVPWLEAMTPALYWTMVTFGRWEDILKEPLPPSDLRYTTGMAYYARGMAFAATSRWAEARAALDTVRAVAGAVPEGENQVALQIAGHALAGEILLRREDARGAVEEFRAAVVLEDALPYTEPPSWYYPMRQSLGKALIAARRLSEAEQAYREDLERFPENGWSLFGLSQSLAAQGRKAEAQEALDRFNRAWAQSDVRLKGSRF